MKPHEKTTSEIRQQIYARFLADAKQVTLSSEFSISRQIVTQIVKAYAAAEEGNTHPGRRRRNLAKLIPDKLEAMRSLVTSRTPGELGHSDFQGWNPHAVQKVMDHLFKFRLMLPEALGLLRDWGVECSAGAGNSPAIPRRGFADEAPLPAFFEYMASLEGLAVQDGISRFIEQDRRAQAAAGIRGWRTKKLGRHFSINANPNPEAPEEAGTIHSHGETLRRLAAARGLIGDAQVRRVLDHYEKRSYQVRAPGQE